MCSTCTHSYIHIVDHYSKHITHIYIYMYNVYCMTYICTHNTHTSHIHKTQMIFVCLLVSQGSTSRCSWNLVCKWWSVEHENWLCCWLVTIGKWGISRLKNGGKWWYCRYILWIFMKNLDHLEFSWGFYMGFHGIDLTNNIHLYASMELGILKMSRKQR